MRIKKHGVIQKYFFALVIKMINIPTKKVRMLSGPRKVGGYENMFRQQLKALSTNLITNHYLHSNSHQNLNLPLVLKNIHHRLLQHLKNVHLNLLQNLKKCVPNSINIDEFEIIKTAKKTDHWQKILCKNGMID